MPHNLNRANAIAVLMVITALCIAE